MKRTTTLAAFILAGLFALSNSPAIAQDLDAPADAAQSVADTAEHAAEDAHAGGGSHGSSPSVIEGPKAGLIPAITALLSFGVVFGVLYVVVWPKLVQGLDERANKITEEIAAAENARAQAKDALADYEKSLSEARSEAQAMLDETKNQQAGLAAELRIKADAELNELRDRAKRDIEAAKKQALNEIYNESVNLAALMAGKILEREVNAGDQKRLVEESLAELASRGN